MQTRERTLSAKSVKEVHTDLRMELTLLSRLGEMWLVLPLPETFRIRCCDERVPSHCPHGPALVKRHAAASQQAASIGSVMHGAFLSGKLRHPGITRYSVEIPRWP